MHKLSLFKDLFILVASLTITTLSFADTEENQVNQSKQIDVLITKAQQAKEASEAKRYWQEAALLHSGLANIKLAQLSLKEKPINRKQAIYYYTQAAQYGYPESYQKVAELVKLQQAKGSKESLLDECYQNIAKAAPDNSLLNYCQSAFVGSFHYGKNQGVQSDGEAAQKAADDLQQFCRDPNAARWIHPDISQLERHALFSLLCQEASKTQSALNIGDVVLQDDKLLQMTDTGLQPYLTSLHDGDVVYRLNPPISLLLYDNGQLKVANNGDTVIKDNQAFVVENNQLVKR